jgi:hypothetical protein
VLVGQIQNCVDIVFEVPVGTPEWPKEMHEPLLIGVLFPFIRAKPWQLRSTPKMFAMARKLRGVLGDSEMDGRDLPYQQQVSEKFGNFS